MDKKESRNAVADLTWDEISRRIPRGAPANAKAVTFDAGRAACADSRDADETVAVRQARAERINAWPLSRDNHIARGVMVT